MIVAVAALATAAVIAAPSLHAPAAPGPGPNSVVQTDRTWVCNSAVDLDLVSVTMTPSASGAANARDAIHLQPGCTGRIGEIDVTTSVADGVKVAAGVHDLEVDGGSIRCLAKAPTLHQDGIQVMGGDRITFRNLKIDCGRLSDTLINSNMFINMAGRATTPPTDVVCDGCTFGGGAAHTVLIQNSIRSGVSNSTLCRGKYAGLTLTIGSVAVDPVNVDNTLVDCGTGGNTGGGGGSTTTKLSLHARSPSITFGGSVVLVGSFKQGRRVTMYAKPYGASAYAPVTTLPTDASGGWQLAVHPKISTSYRAASKAATSPVVLVGVRPRVGLTRAAQHLVVHVSARTSFRSKPYVLQRFRSGRWVAVAHGRLGTGGPVTFPGTLHGARVRALVPATPGYLAATSPPITVR